MIGYLTFEFCYEYNVFQLRLMKTKLEKLEKEFEDEKGKMCSVSEQSNDDTSGGS